MAATATSRSAVRRALRLLSPRRAADTARHLRDDAAFVVGVLRGRGPGPTLPRDARPPRPAATARPDVRPMRVAALVRETPDAVTVRLEPVSGPPVAWLAGQFVTVDVALDGRPLRRCYSLSASPATGDAPAFTVKRVPDGRVSTWLTTRLAVGDVLPVGAPAGRFALEPAPASARRALLVAGGSGITPLHAIARTALAAEPGARLALLYGNRGRGDVIFADALARLAAEHPGRLLVRHALEAPPDGWDGAVGRLAGDTLEGELAAALAWLGEDGDPVEAWICGPTPMMDGARAALLARGLPEERVHLEHFTRGRPAASAAAGRAAQVARVRLGGAEHEIPVPAGRTLLEAGLDAGLAMPYTCTLGGCGACRVRVVEGRAEMDGPHCLTAAEVADGHVLACLAHPATAVTVEVPR